MNRSALMLAFLAVHLTACAAVIPARVRERPPTASQLLHVVSAMDDDLTVPLGLFDISTVTPTEVTAPLVRVLTLDRADLAAMLLMEGDSSILVLIDLFMKLVLGALRSWKVDGKTCSILLFLSATCIRTCCAGPLVRPGRCCKRRTRTCTR